jgi:hypothetical protein
MREPLNTRFDAALNLFTTFGYFLKDEENARVLKSVNAMLKPEGVFMIDYLNAVKVRNELTPKAKGRLDGIDYAVEKHIKNGIVHKNIRFTGKEIGQPKEYNERVKLYGRQWFEENLGSAGFTVENMWGDYEGNIFDESSSPRLIIVAKKRA